MRVGIDLLGVHFLRLFSDLFVNFRRVFHNIIAAEGFEISLLHALLQPLEPIKHLFERLRARVGPWKLLQQALETLEVLHPGAGSARSGAPLRCGRGSSAGPL